MCFQGRLHDCFLSHVYLFVSLNSYACYPALLAKNLYWEGILLVHPNLEPKSMPFVSTITTYMWYFLPLQVNCSCATFKTFKTIKPVLCSCFSSWGSIGCFIISFMFIWLHTLTSMHNVLVPNIAKRAGKRVPSP